MADSKISALPASTVPLAGTEVLPIVQSSTTKQVSVANLTAGRSFAALGMTLTSTDAGAAAAPLLELYRDSATPAASDTLGEIEFNGEDSAGNKQAYGLIHASILSPTSTAEQGQIHFETATAGALTEKMIIGTTNLVINEIGAVFNVRIEGDTDANLFYTDATNSRIGVGTASPAAKLDVVGTVGISSTTTLSGLTASTALALNSSKEVVSVTNTGTSNNVLSNSPTLLSPQITTTTTASGAVISTLNGTAGNNTVNSTTYNVTFANSAKVFSVSLGSGDGVLCIANYASSVITILGTTTVIVNSSTPLSGQFGIYKSTNSHDVSFVTGSAATSAYGNWQIICLTSQAS
jgi:hypothetical protein